MGWKYFPFPNGCAVDVWEWINNFILHFKMDVISFPWWDYGSFMRYLATQQTRSRNSLNHCNAEFINTNVWKYRIREIGDGGKTVTRMYHWALVTKLGKKKTDQKCVHIPCYVLHEHIGISFGGDCLVTRFWYQLIAKQYPGDRDCYSIFM